MSGRKTPISSTAKKVCAVIQDSNKDIDMTKLHQWLNDSCTEWSYICHDLDTNENGEIKNQHYHLVFILKKSKIRLSTTLSAIVKNLGCSVFAVSIDKADNYTLCMQYLIHKNNIDKHPYSDLDIVSNLDYSVISIIMDVSEETINFDTLSSICARSMGSRMYIMQEIGIGYYARYRNLIVDILEELNLNGNKNLCVRKPKELK